MTLTLCIQMCKGQGIRFALNRKDQCLCNDTVATAAVHTLSTCNYPCPGDGYQACGSNDIAAFTVNDGKMWLLAICFGQFVKYQSIRNSNFKIDGSINQVRFINIFGLIFRACSSNLYIILRATRLSKALPRKRSQ